MRLLVGIFVPVCVAATAFFACDTKDEPKKASDAASTASPSAEPPPDGEVVEPVLINLTVAKCSDETKGSFVVEADAAGLIACVLVDSEGKPIDAAEVVVSVTAAGAPEAVTPVAKTTSLPWHVGFRRTGTGTIEKISIAFKAAGTAATATAVDARYEWEKDPAFHEGLETLEGMYESLGAFTPVPFDESGSISATLEANQPAQFAFISDDVFKGDFGAANADAYCAEKGKTISDRFLYRAVLSTTEDAKARLAVGEAVFDYAGNLGLLKGSFWNTPWQFRYSASGLRESRLVRKPPFLGFVNRAWTGTSAGGVRDPSGDCAGWTSADSTLVGQVVDPRRQVSVGSQFGGQRRPCSDFARLLCLGTSKP